MITDLILGIFTLGILLFLALALYAAHAAWRTYRPQRPMIKRTPADLKMPFEIVSFSSIERNTSLSGWLILAPPAIRQRHTIVICHQLGGHKGSGLHHAQFYHNAGFDVFAFDLRNHGDSGYDPGVGAMSRRFTNDVRSAIDVVRAHPALNDNKVSLHAFSLSTFPAMVAAQGAANASIDALVLDSGPTLCPSAITRGFLNTFGANVLPAVFRLPFILNAFRGLYTTAVMTMLASDWPSGLNRVSIPCLFIAGENDTVASPVEIESVANQVAKGTLVVVPGAKHLGALRSNREFYIGTVFDFFARQGNVAATSLVS